MCTSVTMRSKDNIHLLARTMDFSFELDPSMVIVPRNQPLEFTNHKTINKHHAFMGLSKDFGNHFILADGINEHGLSAAVLYFEGYATYNSDVVDEKLNLASFEVITYILATCRTANEVKKMFDKTNILDTILPFINTTPPFHWVVLDSSGKSFIIEPLETGITITENHLGVMANSPDINWHLTNVRNYIGITQHALPQLTINGLTFKPLGQVSGTFGIPGDLTPPARFIRALHNKLTVDKVSGENDLVVATNAVLNSVKIPRGTVITQRNTIDYTQYTSFMLNNKLTYYFSLYNNPKLIKVSFDDFDLDGALAIVKDLTNEPTFINLK